jgi:hypothetical protein
MGETGCQEIGNIRLDCAVGRFSEADICGQSDRYF